MIIKIYKTRVNNTVDTVANYMLQEEDQCVAALPERLTCPLALVGTWTGVDLQLTILHLHTHTRTYEHAHQELSVTEY